MEPTFLNFIRAFGVRWFVAMSGPLSVPLAVAAYYVPGDAAKIGLFVTAVCCAIFASYWVWKVEREARLKAQEVAVDRERRRQIAEALNEAFNKTRQLSYASVITAEEYEAWKANINDHTRSKNILRARFPDIQREQRSTEIGYTLASTESSLDNARIRAALTGNLIP